MLYLVVSAGISSSYKIKSPVYKRPEVSTYLTRPPFSSHSLCTLDNSVILHAAPQKGFKVYTNSHTDKCNLLFFTELFSFFLKIFSYVTDWNDKKRGACCCDKDSNSKVFHKSVCSRTRNKLAFHETLKYSPFWKGLSFVSVKERNYNSQKGAVEMFISKWEHVCKDRQRKNFLECGNDL